ncbi:MAG TPA: metal ABC transporter substrate-binding protein [Acidimicrobiales bacterium]|nr:metal ABC transporter substrate-binding protein [Acidimicrobiales bacterium]
MKSLQRTLAVMAATVILGAIATACGKASSSASESNDGKLKIVTTVSPITSIVSSVVGDLADVRGVIPEGADSHTFEPPPSTAKVLAESDVFFVNGLKLDDPTRDLAKDNQKRGAEVVELGTQTITPDQYIYDFSFPKEGGKPNPHLWTDPPYAEDYARIVRDTVVRRDPKNADAYRANYDRFAAEVDRLDAAMKTATATVPKPELLTYHDAYAYFAAHYGWKVIGAIQVSSFEDPTPKEVADLETQIKAEHVPAIFGSEVFPSKVLAQIGKDTGVRYVDTLRDDDLPGKPGDADHSWIGLMRADFVTMVSSLGGDAGPLKALTVDSAASDKAHYPQ